VENSVASRNAFPVNYALYQQCAERFSLYECLQSSITAGHRATNVSTDASVLCPVYVVVTHILFTYIPTSPESLHQQWQFYKREGLHKFCQHPRILCRNQMGILVTAHRLFLSELLPFHFLEYWSLRSSAMRWILRLMVLLYKGDFESSLLAYSPTIMSTISTAAGKISSSTKERGFYISQLCMPLCRTQTNHCLVLMLVLKITFFFFFFQFF